MKTKLLNWLKNAPKWIVWIVKAIFWILRNKQLAKNFIDEIKDSKTKIQGKTKEIKADDKITKQEVAELINLIVKETPEVAEAFVKLLLAK